MAPKAAEKAPAKKAAPPSALTEFDILYFSPCGNPIDLNICPFRVGH